MGWPRAPPPPSHEITRAPTSLTGSSATRLMAKFSFTWTQSHFNIIMKTEEMKDTSLCHTDEPLFMHSRCLLYLFLPPNKPRSSVILFIIHLQAKNNIYNYHFILWLNDLHSHLLIGQHLDWQETTTDLFTFKSFYLFIYYLLGPLLNELMMTFLVSLQGRFYFKPGKCKNIS